MCKNDLDRTAIDFQINPKLCAQSHSFLDLSFDKTYSSYSNQLLSYTRTAALCEHGVTEVFDAGETTHMHDRIVVINMDGNRQKIVSNDCGSIAKMTLMQYCRTRSHYMFVFSVKTDAVDPNGRQNRDYMFVRKSNEEMKSIFENPSAKLIENDESVGILLNNTDMEQIELCKIRDRRRRQPRSPEEPPE